MKNLTLATVAGIGLSFIAVNAIAGHGGKGGHFDKMDANGDGKVTEEEMSARHATLIEKADTDGDGALSKDEIKAYHKKKREERRGKVGVIGLDAMEILRLESGAPRPGVDFVYQPSFDHEEKPKGPAYIGLPHLAP